MHHKLKVHVPCESFEENCAQTMIFSNTPLNMRGHHFLVHGTQKWFTPVFMHFRLFKDVVILVLRVSYSTLQFLLRRMSKLYLYTFKPKILCSSPFKEYQASSSGLKIYCIFYLTKLLGFVCIKSSSLNVKILRSL